jgi:hypothetical protein
MFYSKRNRKHHHVQNEAYVIPIEDKIRPIVLPAWHFFEEKEKLYNLLVQYEKYTVCLPYKYRNKPEEYIAEPPIEA